MKSSTIAIAFIALIGMTICHLDFKVSSSEECNNSVDAFRNDAQEIWKLYQNGDEIYIEMMLYGSNTDLASAISKCKSGNASQKCISDLDNLAKYLDQLSSAIKTGGDRDAIGTPVTKMYDLASKTQTVCSSSSLELTDKTTCLLAIKDLTVDSIALEKAISTKQFVKIGVLTAKVLKDGQKVKTECKSTIESQVGDEIEDIKACLQKVEVLLDDIEVIEKDYESSNYVNLIKDILKAKPDVQATKEVCSKVVPSH
jgi:hypothetical protein